MAAGQLIAFFLSVVLSRLYSPEHFGKYVVFSSIFSILSISLMGRFEQGIIFAKITKESAGLLVVGVLLSICISTLFLTIGYIILPYNSISELDKFQFLFLVCSTSLLCMWQRALGLVVVRLRDEKAIARLNFVRPISVPIAQTVLGYINASTSALIFGQLLAYLFLLINIFYINKNIKFYAKFKRIKELIKLSKKYYKYPLYNLPQNVLYVSAEAILPLIISHVYGATAAGVYWFASKIAAAPSQVLVESIRPTIYRDVTKIGNDEKNKKFILMNMSIKLSLPLLIIFLFIYLVGDEVFNFVFGKNWAGASTIVLALVLLNIFNAAIVPYIAILMIKGKQKIHLLFEIVATIVRCGSVFFISGHTLYFSLFISIVGVGLIYLVLIGMTLKDIELNL
jgi:O-antigen/teichoic acid export membrane protein